MEINSIIAARTAPYRLPSELAKYVDSKGPLFQLAKDVLDEQIRKLVEYPSIYAFEPDDAKVLELVVDAGWAGHASVFTHLSDGSENPLFDLTEEALIYHGVPYHPSGKVTTYRHRKINRITPMQVADELARSHPLGRARPPNAQGTSSQFIPQLIPSGSGTIQVGARTTQSAAQAFTHALNTHLGARTTQSAAQAFTHALNTGSGLGTSHHSGVEAESSRTTASRLFRNLPPTVSRPSVPNMFASLTPESLAIAVTQAFTTGALTTQSAAQAFTHALNTGALSTQAASAVSQALIIARQGLSTQALSIGTRTVSQGLGTPPLYTASQGLSTQALSIGTHIVSQGLGTTPLYIASQGLSTQALSIGTHTVSQGLGTTPLYIASKGLCTQALNISTTHAVSQGLSSPPLDIGDFSSPSPTPPLAGSPHNQAIALLSEVDKDFDDWEAQSLSNPQTMMSTTTTTTTHTIFESTSVLGPRGHEDAGHGSRNVRHKPED